jgi:ribosomal protein S18 acetylase RimI-like enzyme
VTAIPVPSAEPRTDLSPDALLRAIVDDFRASAVRRRCLAGERVVDTPTLLAYVSDVDSPDVNEVVRARFGGPDASDVDAAIDDAAGLFGDRAFFWWIAPDDEPGDLGQRLDAHGIHFLDDIPGMAMDLAHLGEPADAPPPRGLAIAPVLDADGLADFHRVIIDGFPEDVTDSAAPAAIAAGARAVAEETGYREPNGVPTRWLGRVDGRPVATARLHAGAGVAGIYTVITAAGARRRGYGEALTRAALVAARDAGLRIATLQASQDGRGIYERIGFREVCRFRLHEWRPRPGRPTGPRASAPGRSAESARDGGH